MAEEKKPEKAADIPGLTKPIDGNGTIPDHIHEDTLMFKGIDPDTKERVSVNLPALKKEFGEKKGMEMYTKIAKLGGFFDPGMEPVGSNFFPDLSLEGMNSDTKTKIDAILKGK